MGYDGEVLKYCPGDIDFSNTWAVVVSGAEWNPCGHMLLCCGSNSENGWYWHVSGEGLEELGGILAYPKFFRGDRAFARYLQENNKYEIRRVNCRITEPNGCHQKLEAYMGSPWFWRGLWHNCATFVEDVVQAGGGSLTVSQNCPDQEYAPKVDKAMKVIKIIGRAALKRF